MDVMVDDWKMAQERAEEAGHGPANLKLFKDLVPGDAYVWLGDEFETRWWPRGDETHVWTMQVKTWSGRGAVVQINPQQDVAAWRTREVNYGTARCPTCLCYVQRGHVPGSEDCLMGGAERTKSQRDWEVDW